MKTQKGKDRRRDGQEGDHGTGILGGLADLVQKLSDLAEAGETLKGTREFNLKSGDKETKGVMGFSVKVGLDRDAGIRVEPFGNVHRDQTTGKTVVEEIREPMVDVFEEEEHILVIAEMPGIAAEDVHFDVSGDILTLSAAKGDKKYSKEVLLPRSVPPEKISVSCNNGIVEITCRK